MTASTAQTFDIADAVVARGAAALARINAAEAAFAKAVTRQDWKEVGEGLLVGRRKYPADRAFSAWCESEGYTLDSVTRSNTLWLASNWSGLDGVQTTVNHPTHIRAAHRKLTAPAVKPKAVPKPPAKAAPAFAQASTAPVASATLMDKRAAHDCSKNVCAYLTYRAFQKPPVPPPAP